MENLTVHLKGEPCYDIVYARDFQGLTDLLVKQGCGDRKVCIVSESHVASLFMDAILLCAENVCKSVTSFVFPEGEESKNLNVVRDLYEFLIQNKFDRKDMLIALGGGVVGDLTGFAAATYLRGIDFIQIPTSLLSQVDSSIGGKTGVDFDSYKNMVGAFYMPKLVYINLSALQSLSDRQFCSGMGEIVKHGLIRDKAYFEWLLAHAEAVNNQEADAICHAVRVSNLIKRQVVENDPTEQGERAILNFGHTLGHAIEKYMNFEFMHGECVLLGCALASVISYNKGNIDRACLDRILAAIKAYNVPKLPENADFDRIIAYTKNDKKMEGDKVKFVLLRDIGDAYIDRTVTDNDMLTALKQLKEIYDDAI